MRADRRPVSILLIDGSQRWSTPVKAALADSGRPFALTSIADAAGCWHELPCGEPDVILFSQASSGSAWHAAFEATIRHWRHVPTISLVEGPTLDFAGEAPPHAFDRLSADELGRLAHVIERAIESSQQAGRQRRQAHAQALLAAHARIVRKAANVTELLNGTREMSLGPEWKSMAIILLDGEGQAASQSQGSLDTPAAPGIAAALERLVMQARQARESGQWLRGQAEGSALLALPIGCPAWALLTLVAAGENPIEEDLEALATIVNDVDDASKFLATREQVEYRARHNPVTGFPNRTAFEMALQSRMEQGTLLVAMLDIDRFGQFNHSRSRRFGDALLGAIGAQLRGRLPDGALFGHPQEDDFLIAFDFAHASSEAALTVARLVELTCAEPFMVDGEAITVGMHGSVLLAPAQGSNIDEIERSLSEALIEARASGHLVLAVNEERRLQAPLRAALERELRGAIAENQFELFLQPKFDATSQSLSGAEALIRWRHPSRGIVPPALFIPLLEDSGLIIEVGAWVRSEGLGIWTRWQTLGYGHLRVAVNVSPRELRHAGFIAGCEALLAPVSGRHGLDVEITESMLMADISRSIEVLQSLRELGCKISIDDFGTGYSSLNYLSRLPADTLKIDQSFTSALVTSADALSMVTNIIGLAHSLGLSVVAEGVEEEEQANLLRLLRCDELQGYLLGMPVPASEFERLFLDASGDGFQGAPVRRRSQPRIDTRALAAVEPLGPEPVAPGGKRWLVAAAGFALSLVLALGWAWHRSGGAASGSDVASSASMAAIDSIAVLPFRDTSRGKASQYLAEGLSDELIDRLSRIPHLRVIARGSALTLEDMDQDASQVARTLDVSSVLSGRLHRDGSRLSLDVELIGGDGTRLWTQRYQGDMTDLLRIEEGLTLAVAAALRLRLLPEQEKALVRRTVTNPEAYNQYLLGRSFFRQSTPESFSLSKSALEISIALDPSFAPAHAELANTVSYLADTAETAQGVAAGHARARALADKAVALDPQSAAGYRVRASLRALAFDFKGAMRDTVRALRLNGGDSDNLRRYGLLLLSQGRLDEALMTTSRAAELDPLSANAYVVLGMIYNAQEEPDAAIAALDEALQLTPGHAYAQGNLVQAWLLKGDAARARAVAEAMKPGLWRTFALALSEHSLGNRELADAALAELIRTSADGAAYQIAEAYAWRGENEPAFEWLERAFQQHDGGLEQIRNDPLLRSLRDDPRFPALLAQLNLPD